jgi:hypothetical protein
MSRKSKHEELKARAFGSVFKGEVESNDIMKGERQTDSRGERAKDPIDVRNKGVLMGRARK